MASSIAHWPSGRKTASRRAPKWRLPCGPRTKRRVADPAMANALVPSLKGKMRAIGVTDTGRVREHNEDTIQYDTDIGLYVLADGMGGYNAGEVASGIAVVVDHQHPQREPACRAPGGALRAASRRFDQRQAERERAALPRSLAGGGDAAAVHLHQAPDQGEADPEAALAAATRARDLREHVEDALEHVRGDPDAEVPDRDHRLPALAAGGEHDHAGAATVLRGVV